MVVKQYPDQLPQIELLDRLLHNDFELDCAEGTIVLWLWGCKEDSDMMYQITPDDCAELGRYFTELSEKLRR